MTFVIVRINLYLVAQKSNIIWIVKKEKEVMILWNTVVVEKG